MGEDQLGKFVEPPLLGEELPRPPDGIIATSGPRLVKIFDAPGNAKKADGGRQAVIVAEAPLADGARGILLAWASHYAYTDPPHQTEKARWGWYRHDETRVREQRPPTILYEGAAWHGWGEDGELDTAIRAAVATLPFRLHGVASRPAPMA